LGDCLSKNAGAPANAKPASGSSGTLDSSTSATAASSYARILGAAGNAGTAGGTGMSTNNATRTESPKQIGTSSSNDSTQVSASASPTNQSPSRSSAGKTASVS